MEDNVHNNSVDRIDPLHGEHFHNFCPVVVFKLECLLDNDKGSLFSKMEILQMLGWRHVTFHFQMLTLFCVVVASDLRGQV